MSTCIVSALIKQANLGDEDEENAARWFYEKAKQSLRYLLVLEIEDNHLECVRTLLSNGVPKSKLKSWSGSIWDTASCLSNPAPMFRILFEAKLHPFQFDPMSKSYIFRNLLQKPFLKLLRQDQKRTFPNQQASIHAVQQVGGAIVVSPLFQKELEMLVKAMSFGNMSIGNWLAKEKLMIEVVVSTKPTYAHFDGYRTTAFSIDLK